MEDVIHPSAMGASARKGEAAQSLVVIHDTITAMHPDLCPMAQSHITSKTVPHQSGQIADQIRRHQDRQRSQYGPSSVNKTVTPVTKKKAAKSDDSDLIRTVAMLEKTVAALTTQLSDQQGTYIDKIDKMQTEIDYLGALPDPYAAALRSATSYAPESEFSSGAAPVDRRSMVDEYAEKVAADKLTFLRSLAISGDPATREGAQKQIDKMLKA